MTDINVGTPNGSIDAVLEIPSGEGPWPGIVVIHDAFGLREPHREIARRIADLQEVLADGPMEPARAVRIIEQVAPALLARAPARA